MNKLRNFFESAKIVNGVKIFDTGNMIVLAEDEKFSPPYGIVKCCIKSRQQLNHFLNYLIEGSFIEKTNKGYDARYKLTEEYHYKACLKNVKESLDGYKNDEVIGSEKIRIYLGSKKPRIIPYNKFEWILYGFPIEILNILSPIEKERLKESIESIEINLKKLIELSFNKKNKIKSKNIRDIGTLTLHFRCLSEKKLDLFILVSLVSFPIPEPSCSSFSS